MNLEKLTVPKGMYKGQHMTLVPDTFCFNVIVNPQPWRDHPEVEAYIRKYRPEVIDLVNRRNNHTGPLTGDDLMTGGKYKNRKLKEVPAKYLLELRDAGSLNGWKNGAALEEYVRRNETELIAMAPKYAGAKVKLEYAPPICEKRAYASKDEARRALKKIRAAGSKDKQTGRIPDRSYECPDCSYWHLTSQPHNSWREA